MKKEWDKAIKELGKLAIGTECVLKAEQWKGERMVYHAHVLGVGETYNRDGSPFFTPLEAVDYIRSLVETIRLLQ